MCHCSTSDVATTGQRVVPFPLRCTWTQFNIFSLFRATVNCLWLPTAYLSLTSKLSNMNLCIRLDGKVKLCMSSCKAQETTKRKVQLMMRGILHTHEPASAQGSGVYLLEAAHKVVANWRSGQVGRARAPANIEEVVGAEHRVVLLSVPCGSQNPIHWYGHLDTKHRERTGNTQTELQHCTLVPCSPPSSSSLW